MPSAQQPPMREFARQLQILFGSGKLFVSGLRFREILPGVDQRHRAHRLRRGRLHRVRSSAFVHQHCQLPVAKTLGRLPDIVGQQRPPLHGIFPMEKTLRRRSIAEEGMVRPVRQTQRAQSAKENENLPRRSRMVGEEIALLSRVIVPHEPHVNVEM